MDKIKFFAKSIGIIIVILCLVGLAQSHDIGQVPWILFGLVLACIKS